MDLTPVNPISQFPTPAYHVDPTTPHWQDGTLPTALYPQGAYISGDSPDFILFDHLPSAITMQETGRCPFPSPDQVDDDNWPADFLDLVSGFNAASVEASNHIQSPYNTPVMTPIAAQSLAPQLQHEQVIPTYQPPRKRRQVNKQNLNLTV